MTFKEGDTVRIVSRAINAEDRRTGRYFEHMSGLTGTVENVYSDGTVAVQINKDSLSEVSAEVHKVAVRRMREKFQESLSEEAKKMLTAEELHFDAHYMHLVQVSDLEKAP